MSQSALFDKKCSMSYLRCQHEEKQADMFITRAHDSPAISEQQHTLIIII
jgi:hypothetical protein